MTRMSSFGDFDPEALKKMYDAELNFAETHNDLEVSPQRNQSGYPTMSFDFAKCQRRDGSIYGIPAGAECQEGKAVKGEEKEVALTPGQLQKMPFGKVYNMFHSTPSGTPEDKMIREELHRRSAMPGLAKLSPAQKDKVRGLSSSQKRKLIALTPEEFDRALDAAVKKSVERDRANPGPLRGRTPITPTREMLGWPLIKRV